VTSRKLLQQELFRKSQGNAGASPREPNEYGITKAAIWKPNQSPKKSGNWQRSFSPALRCNLRFE
jgi:hypothetical protein